MARRKQTISNILAFIAIGVGLLLIALAVLTLLPKAKTVDTFEACKAAGGSIAESYPEQCFINGKSFVNEAQRADQGKSYIGLTERGALEKAEREGKTARTVEREGESLPITMDFSQGRLNFFIKEGKVYKVNVEGVN